MTFFSADGLSDGEIRLRLTSAADAIPEKKRLPVYSFEIETAAGERAGRCELRIGQNEKTRIGGNIAYTVFPPFRGRHYAAKACRLLFSLACRHGMSSLYITCAPENAASARTCEAAGGICLGTEDVQKGDEAYAAGKRQVKVYLFDLLKL